jgi:hypothetical protein
MMGGTSGFMILEDMYGLICGDLEANNILFLLRWDVGMTTCQPVSSGHDDGRGVEDWSEFSVIP